MTVCDNRVLIWSVTTNCRQTLKNVTARFNATTGWGVFSRTVCRRLFRYGYKCLVISKKITISPVNCERRIGFCLRKLYCTIQNQWSIFRDENKIVFGQTIKFMSGDDLMRRCVPIVWVSAMTEKQIAVHQWCSGDVFPTMAWVHWFLLRKIWTLKKTYSSIRWRSLACYCRHFSNHQWIFQEDNAPCHALARDNQWKLENSMNMASTEAWSQHYRKCLENAQT